MELPQIGLGTCFGTPEEMKQATKWALENGYRLIDCAPRYENQVAIGQGYGPFCKLDNILIKCSV